MNKFVWLISGLALYAAYHIININAHVLPVSKAAPVEDLAHKLQDAWADHHTVV